MHKRYEELDQNNKLVWNFRDIGHTMRHISEGKGSQQRILIVLNETGPITQSELTQQLGIQPGSASEVVIKLEIAGLIERLPSENDKRTTTVCLTDAGKNEALRLSSIRTERHERMFASLTNNEKDALLCLLEKINADWDKQYRQNADDQGERHHERRRRRGE